jgi:NAD/NADP transhydrogenase alpha subunit/aspartate/methionine/tyrosine aminotransferase
MARGPDAVRGLRLPSYTSDEPPLTSSELPASSPATGSRSTRLRQLLGEQGIPIIDVYHGEMRFTMHPQVQKAVIDTTRELLTENASLLEPDSRPFDKSQPRLLRQLAAERLYMRWRKAGLAVSPDDVLVCPYSSLTMLEAAMASVARPDGVILCPEGFYKSNRQHIEKLGLSIRLFPVRLDLDGKIDPWYLRRAIQAHREQLCALLFTMPGNPLIATYSAEELQAIGRVIIEEDMRVIVDATLDAVVSDYVPLAAITVDSGGKTQSLFDRTVTIAGLSKGHHAIGPYKIGAAITGDVQWRADICRHLAVPLQRETTALARVVLEQTPEEFFRANRLTLAQAQMEARRLCKELEDTFGFPAVMPVGSSLNGPFLLIRLADKVLRQAGIKDGWQLAEFLLGGAGLETVAGPLMGVQEPVVRINVDAPRIGVRKDPALLPQVFARLTALVQAVLDGKLTYQGVLASIDEPSRISISGPLDAVVPGSAAKVIVLKEDQPGEHRVALTPRTTAELGARGMRVWMEAGAGSRAGYEDEVYIEAGATITAARSELFQDADVIAWVKPPSDLDRVLCHLPLGCTIVGFTHPLHDDTIAQQAHGRNLRVQSLELLSQKGILPAQDALAAMGRFAGRIALEEALDLRDHLGHCGPQSILIIGAGHAGMQAAQLATVLGHIVAVASTGQRHSREVEQLLGAAYYNIDSAAVNVPAPLRQQQILAQVITLHRPNVIIAAAKHKDEKAPFLLPGHMLEQLPRDTVVVDLNATRGSSAAGSQVDKQVQTENGVWICNRSNYPNAEPAEASSAYAACLVGILSDKGLSLERALLPPRSVAYV